MIESFLRIPKQSLEQRLLQLEKDIEERQDIRDRSLSELFTQRVQLRDRAYRFKYQFDLRIHLDMKRQISHLDAHILKEQLGCFHDLSEFRYHLSKLQEELLLTEEKLKLIQ